MSSEAIKWARTQNFGSLSLKALVGAIAVRSDKSGTSYVRQRTLAEDLGTSARHVRALLAKAEALRIIQRQARSAGSRGRISDVTMLAMHRSFNLSAAELRRELKASEKGGASGSGVPVGTGGRKRNKTSLASGTRLPHYSRKVEQIPSQGETSSTSQNLALPPNPPRLVVVGGMALAREDDR